MISDHHRKKTPDRKFSCFGRVHCLLGLILMMMSLGSMATLCLFCILVPNGNAGHIQARNDTDSHDHPLRTTFLYPLMGGNFSKPPIIVHPNQNASYVSFPPSSSVANNNLSNSFTSFLNNSSPHPFSSFAPYAPGVLRKPFYPHQNYPFGNHYNFPSDAWTSLLPSSNPVFSNSFNPILLQNPPINPPFSGNMNVATTPSTPTAMSTDKPLPIHLNNQLASLLVDPSLRPLPAAPIYQGSYRWFDYGKTHKVKPYQKPLPLLTSLTNPLGRPVHGRHQATPLMHPSSHHRPSFSSMRPNSNPRPGMHSSRLIPRILETNIASKITNGMENSQEVLEMQSQGMFSSTTDSSLKKEDNNQLRSPQDQELYEHFQLICIQMKGYRCDSGSASERYSHETQKTENNQQSKSIATNLPESDAESDNESPSSE